MKGLNKAIMDYLKSFSERVENKDILDMGCGTGNYTFLFAKKNRVVGTDIQDVVNEKYRNFEFKIADATNLPFSDEIFDLAISFDVIEHIENDKKMLNEAYRVLKKGGELFLETPNRDRFSHILMKLFGADIKYPLNLGTNDNLGETIHIREYTAEELGALAKAAGFENIQVKPFWFGVPFFRYGLTNPPKFLQKNCHCLILSAIKS
ncbi:MAG: methyltransferase domain-containing protein [Patescibacteria group bacterium]